MSYNLTGRPTGYLCAFGAGKFNQSVYGGGAYATIPFDTTTDFSIETWILPTTSAGFQIAFGKDNDFFMGIKGDGNYSVQYNTSSGTTAVGSFPVPTDGLFHHISFNHNHLAGTTFYVDGVLVGSNPLVINVNPTIDFYVLNIRPGNDSQSWGGYVEDLVIWNSVKRTANFSVPTIATSNSEPGMTALYHFDGDLVDSAYLAGNKVNLTGPTTGLNNTSSSDFSVAANGAIVADVIVTPSDAGNGGTFTPSTITLTSASLSGTFKYTPTSNGAKTISITNSGNLQNSPALTYTVTTAATTLSITGPTFCRAPSESSPFTVTPNGAIVGTVIVTPTDGSGGVFTPNTLTLNSAASTGSFTYVSATIGNKSITITNNGGLTNPAAIIVVANPAKVAAPTASTAGNRVVTVGTGQQYATLSSFADYLATQNLVINQEIIIAECYENVSLGLKKLAPLACSQDYYCLVRPVPGYDESSLNPTGPVIFGTEGIQLTLVSAQVSTGMSIRGFNLLCPDGVPYDASCTFANFGLTGRPYELIGNRILSQVTNKPFTFAISTDYSSGVFTDNTYEQIGTADFTGGAYGTVTVSRNTFIVKSGVTTSALMSLQGNNSGGSVIQSNAFINYGGAPFYTQANLGPHCSNNYTNTALTSPISGFTSVTTSALVVSNNDLRPAAGSALLGNAGSSSISVNDIRKNNRGLTPDVGAIQLVPAVPLPTGTVTSQPSPDGQNVTISFNTTGAPSSGVANMAASSASPAGAISTLGVVTFGTNTGVATWTGIPTGNYTPSIKISNSGGANDVLGVAGVTIIGISGNPVAAPAPQGPATSLSLIGPSSGTSGALSQDFIVTLNGSISSNVVVSLASSVAGDTFTPTSLTLTSSVLTATFNVTTSSVGQRNISITNSGGLTNPIALSYNAVATPIVSVITISPTNSTGSQQFTAAVTGTNNPSQAVTWTSSGGSISSTGLFSPPALTTAIQILTVTARSVQNITFAATATVTIAALVPIMRTITLTLTDVNNVPLPTVLNLGCAVFAETKPNLYNAPIYKNTGYSTSSMGVLTFSFPSSLAVGTEVGLEVSNTTGSSTQSPPALAFAGPVVLS